MAESITVRDDTTKAVLDGIGVAGRKQVDVCPDIAFLFEASPEYVAREILAKTGIGQSPFVVVAPNIRIYERSDSVDGQNRYVAEHVKLIKHIRETLGLKVLLVPHEIWPSGRDDRHVISDICSRCDSRCGVYCLTEDHSAADLKAVIGCSEAVIGSRYHSLIASLSMGIPSMAISWSHKYEELMQSTGMVEYCVCGATLSGKQLCNKLSHLLADADHVRDYLRQTAEGFRTKIHRLFDETAAIIERASAT